jgi:N-acetylmuramic acid 6-phosphate (MurNAc-6-P) etherase
MANEDLSLLTTEASNPRTKGLDLMSTLEMVPAINLKDKAVTELVAKALPVRGYIWMGAL